MGGKLFLLLFISVLMLAFGNKPRWKSSNEFNEHLNVIQDNKLSNIFLKKRQIWQNYKEKHMKSYDKVEDEEHMRHFLVSHNFVKNHNYQYKQGAVSFKTAINHIADLSLNEYKNLNGYRPLYGVANNGRKNSSRFLAPLNVQIPDEIDWRDHGYVTDVKDQGNCASCWAFSSTGALEGQHKRAFKKLVSLSEQNLIDCSTPYGNKGCMGGLMEFAYQYVKDNKGIDTETSYPYEAKKDSCHFNINSIGADDTGYVELTEGDEEELKIAVATQGPISVAIDASHKSFQLYSSGVFYEKKCSSKNLDHGVLIVGYGTDPEHGDYWIVKNSWSKYWGERGYIRMARNKNNHCGIASKASYPLV